MNEARCSICQYSEPKSFGRPPVGWVEGEIAYEYPEPPTFDCFGARGFFLKLVGVYVCPACQAFALKTMAEIKTFVKARLDIAAKEEPNAQ